MRRGSEWISQGAEILAGADEAGTPRLFDFVIVGSGYGGAVAAARLSRLTHVDGTPISVCILERGLEYLPGDFPSTFEELPAHVRFRRDDEPAKGYNDGLFDLKLAGDVSALVASGLGGGSLINAGVAEEADERTLADGAWPQAWRCDDSWPSLYARARQRLGAEPWPIGAAGKGHEMQDIAARHGTHSRPVTLTIIPPDATPSQARDATPARPCQECGDCFSGCNVGAKRTLSHTYLREAWTHGAELFTGATVERVARPLQGATDHRWRVEFRLSDEKRLRGRAEPFTVLARNVVLSAGTFGTTEILFRSRGDDLSLSPRLGERFSANGDTIGALYGLDRQVDGYADENTPREIRRVGPTITHIVDLRERAAVNPADAVVIENLTVPAPMAWLFGEVLTSLMLPQRWTTADFSTRTATTPDPYVVDDGAGGAMRRSLLVATQGNDGAKGTLEPSFVAPGASEIAGVRVHWPEVGQLPCFKTADRSMLEATPQGAYWLRNPAWQGVPDSPLLDEPTTRGVVTVHPLGGCAMADSWRMGVVDAFGHVFDAPTGDAADTRSCAVHPGLLVLDGSIIPLSLGINPLLTITAVAERCLDEWTLDEGWLERAPQGLRQLPVQAGRLPAVPRTVPPIPTAIRFNERMTGAIVGPSSWNRVTTDLPLQLSMACAFQTIEDLPRFLREQRKHLTLTATFDTALSEWHADELRHVDRTAHGHRLVMPSGEVDWFLQENSGWVRRTLRATWAWTTGRLRADIGARFGRLLNPLSPGLLPPRTGTLVNTGLLGTARALFNALTHFGAPRLLKYDFGALRQDWVLARDEDGRSLLELPEGTRLYGAKSLVYVAGGNPWQQLTNLDLMARSPGGRPFLLARMKFDELFMIDRDRLPMTMLSQSTGVRGLRDMASLALYFGRVIAGTHFPTFRAPNYIEHRPLRRLPLRYADPDSAYAGLQFDQHRFSSPTRARDSVGHVDLVLTHLRRKQLGADDTPVVMFHGFGASGTLFMHEKIRVPMAAYLAGTEGRDVWVVELRTSIALESSHAQWTMDDVAQEDVPSLIREVLRLTSKLQVDVVAHCIGSAMFCMAALSGRLHGLVRRAALMQVGPVVHLPRTNRLRGYLGHRAQQLIGKNVVDSTMDDRAKDADQLLDRVAGSYSYLSGRIPGVWQDRLLERMPLSWTLARNQWRLNVLRSATVFGQLFQWKNMDDPQLLGALPELLGHCNLTTYQQTVYYAFVQRLTNQAGEDVYVTDENIRRFMGFPILFVQGDVNDTFDRRGTLDSARLLKRVHGEDHPVYRTTIPGYGHLDCVVGKDAPTLVYPRMAEFLRTGTLDERHCDDVNPPQRARRGQLQYRQPLIGPWLGHASRDDHGDLTVSLGLKVDDRRTPPPWVVSILVVDGRVLPDSIVFHKAIGGKMPPSWSGTPDSVAQMWPEGELTFTRRIASVVLEGVRSRIQVRVCTPAFDGPSKWPDRDEFLRDWGNERRRIAAHAGIRGVVHRERERVDQVTLLRRWLDQTEHHQFTTFALGSCRQTPLLIDRDLADSAFGRLLREGFRRDVQLDHLLLVGDQIYADSVASVESVRGTRSRFADAHREAWTAPHQRDLMRRLPTYMAVDDHEFTDNYGSTTRADFPREFMDARSTWWRYQLAAGPAGLMSAKPSEEGPAWYPFRASGFDYFVCDTRSEREDGRRVDRLGATIMGATQMAALESWIRATARPGDRPRFIVLPTPIFPWYREAHGRTEYAIRSDAWQRYPSSVEWLLDLIFKDGTGQIVLLSGDYHVFADGFVTLTANDGSAKHVVCRTITTSGIYCPYDFANTDQDELLARVNGAGAGFNWSYRMTRCESGSGYVVVQANEAGVVQATFTSATP